jgi:hypothetical protein
MKNLQNDLSTQAFETLKDREIKASPQAWDRIDAMLTQTEVVKPIFIKNWWPYAASFLILGFLSLFLFDNSGEKATIEVVNSPEKVMEKNETEVLEINGEQTDLPKDQIAQSTKQVTKASNPSLSAVNPVTIEKTFVEKSTPTIAENNEPKNKVSVNANALLQEVEQELYGQKAERNVKIVAGSKIKIDPTLLLDETEHEMNQTFKEKAIEKINHQIKNIKEALVKSE